MVGEEDNTAVSWGLGYRPSKRKWVVEVHRADSRELSADGLYLA